MKTVLYVDDDEDTVEIVKIVLKNSGYQIDSVNDGQSTLEYCANETPDMILMDINMPEMNGIETTKQLRQKGFTNPIIILSASEADEDRNAATAAGCNGYVVKDMEMRGLEKVIDSFIADAGGI